MAAHLQQILQRLAGALQQGNGQPRPREAESEAERESGPRCRRRAAGGCRCSPHHASMRLCTSLAGGQVAQLLLLGNTAQLLPSLQDVRTRDSAGRVVRQQHWSVLIRVMNVCLFTSTGRRSDSRVHPDDSDASVRSDRGLSLPQPLRLRVETVRAGHPTGDAGGGVSRTYKWPVRLEDPSWCASVADMPLCRLSSGSSMRRSMVIASRIGFCRS
jgi:hypothetical protein